jgi:hypothetical protein
LETVLGIEAIDFIFVGVSPPSADVDVAVVSDWSVAYRTVSGAVPYLGTRGGVEAVDNAHIPTAFVSGANVGVAAGDRNISITSGGKIPYLRAGGGVEA